MLSAVKPATPETGARVLVPDRVAPVFPVPLVMPTVMALAKPVALFSLASRAVTSTAKPGPAVAGFGGLTVQTRCVATPGVMLNALLVLPVRPVLAATRV